MKTKKGKYATVSYIIRYTARPVMASSRIIKCDRESKLIEFYDSHEDYIDTYDSFMEKEDWIQIKGTNYGYEEKTPSWVYVEEPDFSDSSCTFL